jgi:hypothetical protein
MRHAYSFRHEREGGLVDSVVGACRFSNRGLCRHWQGDLWYQSALALSPGHSYGACADRSPTIEYLGTCRTHQCLLLRLLRVNSEGASQGTGITDATSKLHTHLPLGGKLECNRLFTETENRRFLRTVSVSKKTRFSISAAHPFGVPEPPAPEH